MGKRNLHISCVRYIKRHNNGKIHPKDTSYYMIAKILEKIAGTNNSHISDDKKRCEIAADVLKISYKHAINKYFTEYPKNKKKLLDRDNPKTFYNSLEWKKIRYKVLVKYGGKCQCCGENGKNKKIHVDHIKPKSKHWDLRLDINNLQVLCEDCNFGKLHIDQTDWRLE